MSNGWNTDGGWPDDDEPQRGSGDGMVCHSCKEEGHMSRNCPSRPQQSGCFKCGEEGHFSRECPNNASSNNRSFTCRKCNEEGHMARDCPTASGGQSCFNCDQPGHFKNECPEPLRERRPFICRNCQESGHAAADCTKPPVARADGTMPVMYIPVQEIITEKTFEQLNYNDGNVDRYSDIPVTVSDSKYATPLRSFEEAELCASLSEKIRMKMKFTKPTPIQKYCIPIIRDGKDLIACSQTGSGKSAAFILPILDDLMNDPSVPDRTEIVGSLPQKPYVVVLSPTRELCRQLYQHFRLFSEEEPRRLGCSVTYGGTQVRADIEALRLGTHVLCAVPGRLSHFVKQGIISFENVRYFVLDEADRMLDEGFQNATDEFHQHPTMPSKENRRTLMFSATFGPAVEQFARAMLRTKETVKVVVGIQGGVNSDINQDFVLTENYRAKRDELLKILDAIPGSKTNDADIPVADRKRVMVFVERKKNADVLAIFLNSSKYSCTTMHGDRDQRQREEALRTFRSGQYSVLVTTEVASRGLDIKGVSLVVNFDLPRDIDQFVHRVGRTGRVGTKGMAISFFEPERDAHLAPQLVKVLNECNQPVPDFISCAASGEPIHSETAFVDETGDDAEVDPDGW